MLAYRHKNIILITLFILSVFVIDYLAPKLAFFQPGKDSGGLLFRILSSGLICVLFYYKITKSIKYAILAFFIWMGLVLLHIIVLIPIQITWNNLLLDHISLFVIMLFIAIVLGIRNNHNILSNN
ncbi:MAG: hypothetical protein KatS3mg035_2241 [Bacteroidia bacterium]|nr:MAG: hypothetical protein KatS3mg035_2241 [Bacteroidia bacterium]